MGSVTFKEIQVVFDGHEHTLPLSGTETADELSDYVVELHPQLEDVTWTACDMQGKETQINAALWYALPVAKLELRRAPPPSITTLAVNRFNRLRARWRATPFVGRKTILREVTQWIEREHAGVHQVLVLTGDVGWGKSALLLELAERAKLKTKVLAYHPCSLDKPCSVDVRHFVRNVAAACRDVFPAYKRMLLGEEGKEARSLLDDAEMPDPIGALRGGVFHPLACMVELESKPSSYCLYVDGLDVAESICKLLSHCDVVSDLPPWLRIVVAIRRDEWTMWRMQWDEVDWLHVVPAIIPAPNNNKEAHKSSDVERWLAVHNRQLDAKQQTAIVEYAADNFLVARETVRAMLHAGGKLMLPQVPNGLAQFYRFYFADAFPNKTSEEWKSARNVLELLVAADYCDIVLSRALVKECMVVNGTLAVDAGFFWPIYLRPVFALLVAEKRCARMRFAHASLPAWLTCAQNKDFHVSLQNGGQRLGVWLSVAILNGSKDEAVARCLDALCNQPLQLQVRMRHARISRDVALRANPARVLALCNSAPADAIDELSRCIFLHTRTATSTQESKVDSAKTTHASSSSSSSSADRPSKSNIADDEDIVMKTADVTDTVSS